MFMMMAMWCGHINYIYFIIFYQRFITMMNILYIKLFCKCICRCTVTCTAGNKCCIFNKLKIRSKLACNAAAS